MGIGSARGEERAIGAAEMAISSPPLEASIEGAHGGAAVGGRWIRPRLFEINEAAQSCLRSGSPRRTSSSVLSSTTRWATRFASP